MRANRAGVRPLADRAADAARRRASATRRRAVRPPLPTRRSCSRRSACSRWPTARPTSRSRARRATERRADDLLQPGVASDGGRAREMLGDAPRWFQLYWSTRDELVESLVRARRGVRLRGDRASRSTRRCSAGARATSTSPTCRSCAARGSRSTRATRCSGGCCRRAARRPRSPTPQPTPNARRTAGADRADARLSRAASSRTCARATRAPPCSASSRSTRGRR